MPGPTVQLSSRRQPPGARVTAAPATGGRAFHRSTTSRWGPRRAKYETYLKRWAAPWVVNTMRFVPWEMRADTPFTCFGAAVVSIPGPSMRILARPSVNGRGSEAKTRFSRSVPSSKLDHDPDEGGMVADADLRGGQSMRLPGAGQGDERGDGNEDPVPHPTEESSFGGRMQGSRARPCVHLPTWIST